MENEKKKSNTFENEKHHTQRQSKIHSNAPQYFECLVFRGWGRKSPGIFQILLAQWLFSNSNVKSDKKKRDLVYVRALFFFCESYYTEFYCLSNKLFSFDNKFHFWYSGVVVVVNSRRGEMTQTVRKYSTFESNVI